MKRIGILLLLAFMICGNVLSQTSWDKISCGSWAEIYLPITMEVQAGIYKKIIDQSKRHFSINAERIVFQQKGLNDGNTGNTYVRVIIRKEFNDETFPDINGISASDINDINDAYQSMTKQSMDNPTYPAKLIRWNKVNIIQLNNARCINYSYIRQMGNNPQTYSEFYIFWRGNIQYSLNIEYWVSDSEKWKSDLAKCIQSFVLK